MMRSNWLMRGQSFRCIDTSDSEASFNVVPPTLYTGHVTTFSYGVAAEDLEPTVFV